MLRKFTVDSRAVGVVGIVDSFFFSFRTTVLSIPYRI